MVFKINVKGYFEENSYFFIDEKTKHGFIIDPGAEGEKLSEIIEYKNWTIEKILLTHGHFDHIGGIKFLKNKYSIPVYAHKESDIYLLDTTMNLSRQCNLNMTSKADYYLEDDEIIKLEANPNFYLQTIFTPGHTIDSCIFYNEGEKIAFVGDTIFKGAIGNPNYLGGNQRELINSIVKKIFVLPNDTILYSGHSDETTVGIERKRYSM